MFGLKILKLAKISLLTSVAIVGLGTVSQVLAGDVYYPTPETPDYPTPVPPVLPPVMPPVQYQQQYQGQAQFQAQAQAQGQGQFQAQAQSQGGFSASVDISATYNRIDVNNGTTTSSSSQKLIELRPFVSYSSEQNGIEFSGSAYSSLSYEIGGTGTAYQLGRSELNIQVKKEADFAFGASGGYNKHYFMSSSPNPATSGSFNVLDASGFAEKRMGQFGLSLIGSYTKETYNATAQSGGGSFAETAKDNTVYGGALRLNYHLDQSASIFAEASYTRKKFVITPTPNRNETAYGIRVGGTYNFSNQVAVEVAGQYGYHLVDCGCITQAFGGDAKLIASLSSNLSASLTAEAELTKSTDPLLDSKSMKFGGDLSFKAAANIDLTAAASYSLALSGPNKGQNISANLSASYAVNSNIDIFAGVDYGYQTSAAPGWSRNYGASLGASFHY